MYSIFKVKGEEYKLEYSIEASLYADCTMSVTTLWENLMSTDDTSKVLSGISNVPTTTLTLLYAGLMEHHGTHPNGDGRVPNIEVAKVIASEYIREHIQAKDGNGNWYSILNTCMEQMGNDSFFDLIGLTDNVME